MGKQPEITPDHPVCSIARSLEYLKDRWTFLIVRNALSGTVRFSDFRDELGISTDLLTRRLAALVDGGILEKRSYQEAGSRARLSYHLTPAGGELLVALGALQQWGDRHCPPQGGPSALRRSRSTGGTLRVAYVDEEGAAVDLADVRMVLVRPPGQG
ncbi:helix-turn-helix domain-containing protein [Streptomyces sp. NPDC047002]|uniref:winged helix-turn-helix transcriptional regulator n=1 Tax=Streptomyces sp. NPDC047002 TaxID=3155475 RepID=UPI0034534D80